MPRKKIAFSRTDVRAMWELMEKMGLEPVSVKFHADGTFRIMTKKHAEIAKPSDAETPKGSYWDKVLSDGST